MNRKGIWLFLPFLLLWSMGCGSRGTVTGTVSYNGAPIPEGAIMFTPDNGAQSVSAPILDGKYTAEKVPLGSAKISVTSVYSQGPATPMQRSMQGGMGKPKEGAEIPEGARKMMQGASQAKKGGGLKIPDQYADPSKSGLTYTVQGGKQTHDIDLK